MNTLNTIKKLNDISAYQRGMFTTAQAKRAGVERYALARLENNGAIERLQRGVYRMGGAPSIREEEVYASWLSLRPNRFPGQQTVLSCVPIATGVTAAWLLGIGEIGPTPLEFCCEDRKQTQRPGLTVRKRRIDPCEIVFTGGMPVTSPFQIILDLIDGGEDLSLISDVLKDALSKGLIPDEAKLKAEVGRRRKKIGVPRDVSPYEMLKGMW